MDDRKKFMIFVVIWFLLSLFIHFGNMTGSNHELITTVSHILTGCVAVIFGILSVRASGVGSKYGKSFLLFTICMSFWTVGNFLWWFVFNQAVVSFSDILWLGGYPLIFFAVLYALQGVTNSILKDRKRLVIAIVLILLFGFLYLKFIPPTWDSNVSDLENFVTIGYVLADLFLIVPLILLITFVLGGEFTVAWIFVALAFTSTMTQDILYASSYDSYVPGDLTDLLGVITYLLFAVAFIFYKPVVAKTDELKKSGESVIATERIVKKTKKTRNKAVKRK